MLRRAGALVAVATTLAVTSVSGTAAPPPVAGCHTWTTFGHDPHHGFAVPAGCAQVDRSTVARLVPAWFHPMKDSITASPTVVDGTVYVGSWDGTFVALDAATGAQRWSFRITQHAPTAFGRIVSTASVSDWRTPSGALRRVVVFGGASTVWVLDAATGHELASLDLDPRTPALRAQQEAGADAPVVEVESSPVLATIGTLRRFFVGLDVHDHPAVGRTGIVSLALHPADGDHWSLIPVWKLDAETGRTYRGTHALTQGSGQGRGCGGVWSSPAVDAPSRTVVFGTASCSHPADQIKANENYEESMVAVDAVTGKLRWRYRPGDALASDAARVADANRDADFGASPNIFSIGGHLVVGEGRKSGEYVVRDLRTGAPVSVTAVGTEGQVSDGFGIGGFLGTTAVGGTAAAPVVVGATAIPFPRSADEVVPDTAAVHAVDPRTGKQLWSYRLAGPSYAPTSISGGVAFVPDTTTSSLLAIDVTTGLPLWAAPVVGPPSSGAVVAGDLVVLGTGTRETDLEYKAVNSSLQDALAGSVGESPLSPISGVQAFRLAPL
ncbi:MAG TPA: PQQ-binding-like beta-propeller repeat protein [Mycobacteriales bacterium]|nr:PQQ-binding-like beta-propeller repeat protein [Mycobacteriales bacterium]